MEVWNYWLRISAKWRYAPKTARKEGFEHFHHQELMHICGDWRGKHFRLMSAHCAEEPKCHHKDVQLQSQPNNKSKHQCLQRTKPYFVINRLLSQSILKGNSQVKIKCVQRKG